MIQSSSSPKVICFFNTNKEWGGGEKWHFDMARRLHDRGQKIILCAYPDSPLFHKALEAEIPVYSFKVNNLSFINFQLINKLRNFFHNKKVTHLLLNLPSDLKTAGRAARAANVNHIIYRRGSAISISNSFFNRYLFKNIVDRMIVNSEETKRLIFSGNPNIFDEDKIHVIYNGIDLDNYPDKEEAFRSDDKKDIVLGNVGRLEKQKNQHFLIDLVSLLHQKGYNVKLQIAGSGRLEQELQNSIKEKKLGKHINLLGFTENVKSFLMSIDIFVLSSLWEGFGYVIAEALACYRPVVAFDTSSNPEIVSHGNDGFLVPKNDLNSFAEAIIYLIDNPELRRNMGDYGAEKVKNSFNIQTTTTNLLNFLQQLG